MCLCTLQAKRLEITVPVEITVKNVSSQKKIMDSKVFINIEQRISLLSEENLASPFLSFFIF